MDTMTMLAVFSAVLVVLGSMQCCESSTTKTVICSRIVSVREDSGPDQVKLEFGGVDPIGCQNHNSDKLLRDGLHASKCEESWFDLKDGVSTFARSIDLLDRSGSLNAFRTVVKEDNQMRSPLCFRHNIPMGGGKLSDDSPRCFNPNGGSFLMFLARKCTNDWCATYWLAAVEGRCDGTQFQPESSGGVDKQEGQHEDQRDESDGKHAENFESSEGQNTNKGSTSSDHSLPRKMSDLSGVPLPPQSGK